MKNVDYKSAEVLFAIQWQAYVYDNDMYKHINELESIGPTTEAKLLRKLKEEWENVLFISNSEFEKVAMRTDTPETMYQLKIRVDTIASNEPGEEISENINCKTQDLICRTLSDCMATCTMGSLMIFSF